MADRIALYVASMGDEFELALHAGGLRFLSCDGLASGVLTLEKLAYDLLQFLFPSANMGGVDNFADGDVLNGFIHP